MFDKFDTIDTYWEYGTIILVFVEASTMPRKSKASSSACRGGPVHPMKKIKNDKTSGNDCARALARWDLE